MTFGLYAFSAHESRFLLDIQEFMRWQFLRRIKIATRDFGNLTSMKISVLIQGLGRHRASSKIVPESAWKFRPSS